MYKLSRYWNRAAYAVIYLGKAMIWDYTERNADLLGDLPDKTAQEILTSATK